MSFRRTIGAVSDIPCGMPDSSHNAVVQESFTRQAQAYAAAPGIADPVRVQRLIDAVDPNPEARVLDVACGPGFLALGFASRCREAIGVDLTDAPLAIANRNQRERGLPNVHFQRADAGRLPFPDADFEVVVCRLAFHHLEEPGRVLREMARVCRNGGRVAVQDLVSSEHPSRAEYQNNVERLRDPSHTRALSASKLIGLFTAAGLEVEAMYSDFLVQDLERWLANSQTPADRAAQVRAMIERDARGDLSGTYPHIEDGRWVFRHLMLAVIGRKLA